MPWLLHWNFLCVWLAPGHLPVLPCVCMGSSSASHPPLLFWKVQYSVYQKTKRQQYTMGGGVIWCTPSLLKSITQCSSLKCIPIDSSAGAPLHCRSGAQVSTLLPEKKKHYLRMFRPQVLYGFALCTLLPPRLLWQLWGFLVGERILIACTTNSCLPILTFDFNWNQSQCEFNQSPSTLCLRNFHCL